MTQPTTVTPPTAAGKAAYWRRLPLSQKLVLAAEIVALYVRTRWLLARRELPEVVAALRGGDALDIPSDGDRLLTGVRLGHIVGKTLGVLPADSRCLVRSCVLSALLARRGIGSVLVIGVVSEPTFTAHAWVECSGVPLLDPGDEEYGRLVEI
jgi:hypothetical protein